MVTLCWAAKGGSGTTVVAAALALSSRRSSLLVDLDGEIPAVLGLPEPDRPGVADWLGERSAAGSAGQPHGRHRPAAPGCCHGVPWRVTAAIPPTSAARMTPPTDRWDELGRWLHDWSTHGDCDVTVDAGTGEPPAGLVAHADRSLLVTRPCYLSLRRAVHAATRPTGIVLVDEPGRALSQRDVEHALGVAVEATVSLDPAVARAVDAGLLATRLPRVISRELRQVAA